MIDWSQRWQRLLGGAPPAEQRRLRESELVLHSLAAASRDAIFRLDVGGVVRYVNERWEQITGHAAADTIGRAWHDLIDPDRRGASGPSTSTLVDRALTGTEPDHTGPTESVPMRIVRPDGGMRWVSGRVTPVRDNGELIGCVGCLTDVTDQVLARRDSQRLTDIFEATQDLVGITNRHGDVLYANAAARSFLGLPPHGLLDGMRLLDWFPPAIGERLANEIITKLEHEGRWDGELAIHRHDGTVVPVLAQLLNHTDEHGRFEFFSGVMHDISNRKRYESQLAHQATHDRLTELPNRTLLLEHLGKALARARHHDTQVAVLFLDLDHFKVVNDSLGHGAGDQLLMVIADRLTSVIRPTDTVARLGGDEFVVVCDDVESRDDATAVASRLNEVANGPFSIDGSDIFVGASIGIVLTSTVLAEMDPAHLVRDADAAMRRAKERGRGGFEVFDETLRSGALDRLGLVNALHRAEARGDLRVLYQPIVSLRSGRVESTEALLRWRHPERGLLAPGQFIPVAEDTGLIVSVGAWVLEQACAQMMLWQAALPHLDPLRVSVNLSSRQLGHPSLVADVRAVVDASGLNPSQIELEITESVLMDDIELSGQTLHRLKSLGVTLVVDDFGTGYSSLSYLRRLPVDGVKIDQSFVWGLGHDPSDVAIVRAIVTLARTLGLRAVAEGVETPEQLAELRRLECDLAQGFWMARPGTGDEVAGLLATDPCW